jgi:hypothetical protein
MRDCSVVAATSPLANCYGDFGARKARPMAPSLMINPAPTTPALADHGAAAGAED